MNIICKSCKVPIELEDKFCGTCGNAIEKEPTEKLCIKCGLKFEEDANFCVGCGNAVEKETSFNVCAKCGVKVESALKECITCTTKTVDKALDTIQPIMVYKSQFSRIGLLIFSVLGIVSLILPWVSIGWFSFNAFNLGEAISDIQAFPFVALGLFGIVAIMALANAKSLKAVSLVVGLLGSAITIIAVYFFSVDIGTLFTRFLGMGAYLFAISSVGIFILSLYRNKS